MVNAHRNAKVVENLVISQPTMEYTVHDNTQYTMSTQITVCGESFNQSSHLNKHMEIHNGDQGDDKEK